MSYTTKIRGDVRPVNTFTTSTTCESLVREALAHESPSAQDGPRIPSADLHARRIAREAEDWIRFASERSSMRPDTVLRKGLDACAFSVRHRSGCLAIPSKLSGVRDYQRTLWGMVQDRVPQWAPLSVQGSGSGGLVVSYDMEVIGEIQPKHEPWLRPLIPFGARIYLSRVTGHERSGYWLGVNVVLGHVGTALAALRHALGADGDIAGGDGSTEEVRASAAIPVTVALGSTSYGGDGHAENGALPALTVLPEVEALTGQPDDIVLWRDPDGTAHATVSHTVRHSPSGIEWGYAGSGPADLARSILLAFTDEAMADALYQAFKAEVVARIPEEGGLITAAEVRGWLARHGATPTA